MDRERFDALTRLLATTPSRRAVLGALLGAGLLGPSRDAKAKKGNGRNRGGKKKARGRTTGTVRAAAIPANCCSDKDCTPGPGKNLAKCCYEDDELPGANFKGANLGSANFSDADLTGADFKGANLGKTCFVAADLTDANLKGANTGTAIFCRTTMPDGRTNDSGCSKGAPCCPTCDEDNPCDDDDEICCNGRCRQQECCVDDDCEESERCDDGMCVPDCLTAGTCCGTDSTACQANCCTGQVGEGLNICGGLGNFHCAFSPPGGRCATGNDCASIATGGCRDGICCSLQGGRCFDAAGCCNEIATCGGALTCSA